MVFNTPFQTLSHAKRMRVSPSPYVYHELECRCYQCCDELGPNGILVKTHKVCTYSPSEQLDNYKVSDFSMSNLQAIGANPSVTFAQNQDKCKTIDQATSMLDSLNNL